MSSKQCSERFQNKGIIFSGAFGASLAFLLRFIVQTITLILLVNTFGLNDFGIYVSISSVAILLGVFSNFGINLLIMSDAANGGVNRLYIISYAIPLILIGSFFFSIFNYVFFIYINPANEFFLKLSLALGFSEIIVQPFLSIISAEMQGRQKIFAAQIVLITPLFLKCIFIGYLFFLKLPKLIFVDLIVYYISISSVVYVLIIYFILDLNWHKISKFKLPSYKEFKNAMSYGLSSFTSLAINEFDKVLAVKFMNGNDAGFYAILTRISGALILPVIAVLSSALPVLFKTSEKVNRVKIIFIVLSASIIYAALITSTVYIFITVINKLYFNNLSLYKEMINLLLISIIPMVLRLNATTILVGIGGQLFRFYTELSGLIIFIIFSLFLNFNGIYLAVPYAMIVAESFMVIVGFISVWRFLILKKII